MRNICFLAEVAEKVAEIFGFWPVLRSYRYCEGKTRRIIYPLVQTFRFVKKMDLLLFKCSSIIRYFRESIYKQSCVCTKSLDVCHRKRIDVFLQTSSKFFQHFTDLHTASADLANCQRNLTHVENSIRVCQAARDQAADIAKRASEEAYQKVSEMVYFETFEFASRHSELSLSHSRTF